MTVNAILDIIVIIIEDTIIHCIFVIVVEVI